MMIRRYLLFLLLVGTLIYSNSCNKEDTFITDSSAQLEFSLDTLRFDTVFTELGSATRFFKIYNRHKESIKISRIYLPEGDNSKFNLNVDGIPGNEAVDVVIYPEDSLYIFAEVTIDPDQPLSSSPFVHLENLMFETNGNEQMIYLEAWGQNANYIPDRFSKDEEVILSCGGGTVTWDDAKPYVIYGIVRIENCTLRIPEGTRVHVHGGLSKVQVTPDSTLIRNSGRLDIGSTAVLEVLGSQESPVVFEGDRLEEDFADASGQWTGVVIYPTSKGNRFEYAVVKNSLLGVWADSASELSLKNTQIYNTSGLGIVGIHSNISAENCLFYNNGSTSVLLTYGGDYDFTYCTLASYGVDAAALSLSNGIRQDQFNPCAAFVYNDLSANFTNCIIAGSRRDEISLANFAACGVDVDFDYNFENCIVKIDELTDPDNGFPDFFDNCDPCFNGTFDDVIFRDINEDDYHLDTLSIAEGMAKAIPGIITDLDGVDRDNENPDIGCYEYVFE